jgi:WYL_2, Sm-like SH3 beta-barrel fold
MKNTLIDSLLQRTEGKFVGITFVKKDGTIRNLNGRFGVKKYVKHESNTLPTAAQQNYFTVYDVKARGYRAVNRETILSVRAMGTEIQNKNKPRRARKSVQSV